MGWGRCANIDYDDMFAGLSIIVVLLVIVMLCVLLVIVMLCSLSLIVDHRCAGLCCCPRHVVRACCHIHVVRSCCLRPLCFIVVIVVLYVLVVFAGLCIPVVVVVLWTLVAKDGVMDSFGTLPESEHSAAWNM